MVNVGIQIGETVRGKFKVIKELAVAGVRKSGMANILLASELGSQKQVVIKEILKSNFSPKDWPEAEKSFKREVENLERFKKNPLIPRIEEWWVESDGCYIVMEFIEGKDLEEFFDEEFTQKGKKMGDKQLIGITKALCNFLKELHKNNVVFRDLKPGNIMVDFSRGNTLRVIDFGIARKVYEQVTGKLIQSQMTGIGTAGFAPPEAYAQPGKPANWTYMGDIYTLAATIWFLSVGNLPQTPFDWGKLHDKRPDLPDEFCVIIDKALMDKIPDRWQSAEEMKKALDQIGKPPPTPPVQQQAVQFFKNAYAGGKKFIDDFRNRQTYGSIPEDLHAAESYAWNDATKKASFNNITTALSTALAQDLENQVRSLYRDAMALAIEDYLSQKGISTRRLGAIQLKAVPIKGFKGQLTVEELNFYKELGSVPLPVKRVAFASFWDGQKNCNSIFLLFADEWYECSLPVAGTPTLQGPKLTMPHLTAHVPPTNP